MTPRPTDYARQFPENGLKLLLQQPLNLRDFLRAVHCEYSDDIDYQRLKPDPTTYVQRDYRHVESDLVLRCPLRRRGSQLPLLLYILLEHQTLPDRFMALRVLEYVVAIYRSQVREWQKLHTSLAKLELMPVMPLVFYTGLRPWPDLGRVADLLAGSGRFAPLAPQLEPLFVSLRDVPARRLAAEGGAFGQVLRLYQQRRAPRTMFHRLLGGVVHELERLPPAQRFRWQGLLSYIHALVYHEREPDEHPEYNDRIEQSVRTEEHREEVSLMRRTIADDLMEKGQMKSLRKTLLRLIQIRIGDPSTDIIAAVEGCSEPGQLEAWIERAATARTLAQIGIPTAS